MANVKKVASLGLTRTGTSIPDVPDAPTIGAVTDLGTGTSVSVAYTAATTGSPTFTNTGGYKIYRWTASGSITF
jgi:hypothetical protein